MTKKKKKKKKKAKNGKKKAGSTNQSNDIKENQMKNVQGIRKLSFTENS